MDVYCVMRTRLLLFNQFNSFLCRNNLAFLRLCRFPQVETLLPSLFGLEHFVLHEGFEDEISLIVIVNAGLHRATFLLIARVGHSGELLTRQAMCPLLQLLLQLI